MSTDTIISVVALAVACFVAGLVAGTSMGLRRVQEKNDALLVLAKELERLRQGADRR